MGVYKLHSEASNHLGNVLTLFTDKKIPVGTGTTVSYYKADLVSSMDYSPFGAPLKGRTFNGSGSRYGFNGQEKDNEVSGAGNSMTAEFWQYDSRLGRRWNIDPKPNPSISYYASFANNPITLGDPFGDTVRVSNSVTDNKLINASFTAFASSKEGVNFISKYASKGQTIGGHTYKKDGEFSLKGIDLNYESKDIIEPGVGGQTSNEIDKNNRAQINITIDNQFTSKSVKGLVDEAMGKVITLYHESFIHADLGAK